MHMIVSTSQLFSKMFRFSQTIMVYLFIFMHLASLYTSFGYNHTKFILLFNGLSHLTQCLQVSCICQNTLSFKGKWYSVLYTYLVYNYFRYNLNTHKMQVFNNSIIYNFDSLKRCDCTSMRAYIKIWSINILKFHTENFNTLIYFLFMHISESLNIHEWTSTLSYEEVKR